MTVDKSVDVQGKIWEAISRLDNWIEQYGWAGYDPYDIKGTPLFLSLQDIDTPLAVKVIRRLALGLERRQPLAARRFLNVKKKINAKGMGLFARAYLNLYQTTGNIAYQEKSLFCLDWLERNSAQGYSGLCWGYPFDWQSVVFIPEGTPSAVVSSVVGDGFWTTYQVLGGRKYLDICDDICRFFISDLNIDQQSDGSVCFSYTPIDDFHVHNANLLVAEFLVRIGNEIGKQEYVELGVQAANYALNEQNPDGSLFYWGRVQNLYSPNHIDHYHSGFEIRALYGLWKWTGDPRYREAVERYYTYYRTNLLTESDGLTAPKMTPNSFYPINIHSCAEAILCNVTLKEEFPVATEILPDLSEWVLSTMQTEAGWFVYLVQHNGAGRRFTKIPYMRWGQAWMLLALSALVEC